MTNSFDVQLRLLYGDRYEPHDGVRTVFMAATGEQELVQWLKSLAEKWFEDQEPNLMPLTVALLNGSGLGHIMAANGAAPDELIRYAQNLILLSHQTGDPMVVAAAVGEAHLMVVNDEEQMPDIMQGLELGTIDLIGQGQAAVTVNVTSNPGGTPKERLIARYVNDEERSFEGEWFEQESDPGRPENILAFTQLAPS